MQISIIYRKEYMPVNVLWGIRDAIIYQEAIESTLLHQFIC